MRLLTRLVLVGPLLSTLAGCGAHSPGESSGNSQLATNPAYERSLNLWLNRSEEDLVAAWGVPERSQRLTVGGQAFEYRRIDGDGKLLCSTLFTSDVYGQIRTWAFRGVNCQAPHLGDYGTRS
jgi:hypothetical protein